MNQPKTSFLLAAFFAVCLSFTASFAQNSVNRSPEPSFDVILQTVIASNAGNRSEISTLSNIVKKLKTEFPFSNYRLASTSIQRISNKGNAESKSVFYTTDKNLAVFSEWTINNLESAIDEKNQETIQVQSFRFGQRIPIPINNATNYEQIGITARFSLPKNTPTVVGSLATANPDELMFIVMTVKPAEK